MKRRQLSGAVKRKLAAEKKKKEEATTSKIPKINELFIAVPSTSSLSATEETKDDETHDLSDYEIHSPATNKDDETEECDLVSEAESVRVNENEFMEFSTDPGLWQIPENIASLQNYWIGKGGTLKLKCVYWSKIFLNFEF